MTIYFLRFKPKVCDGCFNENHNHYYYNVFLKKGSHKFHKYAIL